MKFIYILIIIAISLCQMGYAQTTVMVSPTDDTQLNQAAGVTPLGAQSNLIINPWTPSWTSRLAIKFDLSAYSGSTINSAKLVLFERSTLGTSRTINVHSITTDWDENSAHWGFPWTSTGGDFNGIPASSFTPVWTGVPKKDSIDLTLSVQNFVNGTNSNFGWLLKIDHEDASQQFWEFYSKEWSITTQRPVLIISFNDNTALPIELIEFKVQKENERVKLNWTTASETNNKFFTIQRSLDAINFEEIGTILGAGNSSVTLNYTLYDDNPYEGLTYYRLKQIDFNGDFSYSKIKTVYFSKISIIKIYPNPAKNYVNIIVGTPNETAIDLVVFNHLGQKIIEEKKKTLKGYNTINLNIERLRPGNYVFQVTTPNGEHIENIFIKD